MSDPVKPEEPWQKAENWQQAAIAIAVMLLVGFVAAMLWVVLAPDDAARLLRMQIAGPIGLFGAAAVTFCTVVWRGIISAQQAKLQRVQIDKLAEQIAATNESNLADLLQRGAELLAETEKPAHIAAGIAILRSVVVEKSGLFAIEAMNLLADFLEAEFREQQLSVPFMSAADALEAGSTLGRNSDRLIVLTMSGQRSSWHIRGPLKGLRFARYEYGVWYGDQLERVVEEEIGKCIFAQCIFAYGRIANVKQFFVDCEFNLCKIDEITNNKIFTNRYLDCEFSGATIEDPEAVFQKMRIEDGNWFEPTNPPVTGVPHVDWGRWLSNGKPTTGRRTKSGLD